MTDIYINIIYCSVDGRIKFAVIDVLLIAGVTTIRRKDKEMNNIFKNIDCISLCKYDCGEPFAK